MLLSFQGDSIFMCLSWRDSLVAQLLIEESQQSSGCNGRTDDSRNVWSHGVHEKEVAAVRLLADVMRHAGSHRHGGNAGGADERVNRVLAPAGHQVHELGAEKPADRGHGEGNDAEEDDLERLSLQEALALHGETHGHAEENGRDVHQLILSAIHKTLRHLTLAQEVAEHQHAEERCCIRAQQNGDQGDDEAEEELLPLGDLAQTLHLNLALRLRGT